MSEDNKMTPQFKIGDHVWRASFGSTERYVECPDCGGTGRLRVTFHDETTVSIDCQNCSAGYNPPTGRVKLYSRSGEATMHMVAGIEMETDGIRYRLGVPGAGHYYIGEAHNVFATKDEALARAAELAKEADAEAEAAFLRKEKDTRTWAWNASYHRNEIKRHKQQIEYHTRKLTVASLKAKEDKAA